MKNSGSKRGAILLETLIAMPLYLMLVGGAMWIGELILAKQQLVIGDRYGAWNLGNMHRGGPAGVDTEVQDRLFPPDVFQDQTSRMRPAKSRPAMWPGFLGRWWDGAHASVSLTVKMKAWAEGWLAGSSEVFLDEPYPIKSIFFMTGRERGIRDNHVVIMRTFRSLESASKTPIPWGPGDDWYDDHGMSGDRSQAGDYPRNWDGRALAPFPWKAFVYKEPWPMEPGPVTRAKLILVMNPLKGSEYPRYGPYEAISE